MLRVRLSRIVMLGAVLCCATALGAESSEGLADLDQAFELQLKSSAQTGMEKMRDLEKVIALCESALEKGLNEARTQDAKQLLVSALWQHASDLSALLLGRQGITSQWAMNRKLALQDLEKLLATDETFVDAYLLRAQLLARQRGPQPQGNREQAVKSLDKAVELLVAENAKAVGDSKRVADNNKKRSSAFMLRAQLHEDPAERLADLNAAVEADPTNSEAWQFRTAHHIVQGELEKAVGDFESLLAQDPKNVPLRQALAEALVNALVELEKYDIALAQVNKTIELAPDFSPSYALRALIYEAQKKPQEALADLNKALELEPRNLKALFDRARLQFLGDDLESARTDVDRLLQIQPGMIGGILLRSMISAAQGRLQDAIDDVLLLVQDDPKNVERRLQLAALYVADQRPRKAIEILDKILEDDKENWMALRARGDALLSVGKHAEAIQNYNTAVELKPDDDGILNNLAWVLATSPTAELRDGPRAIRLATKACEVTNYEKPHILSTLAAAYAETGDFETAIKWSTKAVELGKETLKEQLEQLEQELESYQRKEPVRELQDVEEKAAPPRNVIDT